MMKQKRNKGTRWVALLAKGMNLSVKIYLGMKLDNPLEVKRNDEY
jgi:hypothetical protein